MTRWVQFTNVFNFREVVAGKLYRSADLSTLEEVDRQRYQALGVHTVIDLRRAEELSSRGRAPEWSCERWHHLTLTEGAWPDSEGLDEISIAPYLADRYIEMSELGADGLIKGADGT